MQIMAGERTTTGDRGIEWTRISLDPGQECAQLLDGSRRCDLRVIILHSSASHMNFAQHRRRRIEFGDHPIELVFFKCEFDLLTGLTPPKLPIWC